MNTNNKSKIHQLLRHPLLIGAFTVIVGTGFFGWLTERGKNLELRRNKSVSFLEERVGDFNLVLTGIFVHIKNPSERTDENLKELDDRTTNLFTKRLSNEINSTYLLQRPSYSSNYDDLTFEINALVDVFKRIADRRDGEVTDKDDVKNITDEEIKRFANAKIEEFEAKWHISPRAGRVDGVCGELDSLTMMLWDRTKRVHLEQLQAAVGL